MPYKKESELPGAVRNNLPKHAQEIWMKAFDSAWEEYADPKKRRGKESREETAAKVAWAAVKNEYHKDAEGNWVKKAA